MGILYAIFFMVSRVGSPEVVSDLECSCTVVNIQFDTLMVFKYDHEALDFIYECILEENCEVLLVDRIFTGKL